LSNSVFRANAFAGRAAICLFLAICTFPRPIAAQDTQKPQTVITIDSVAVFPAPASQGAAQTTPTQNFVIEIIGQNFGGIADADLKAARIAVFPAAGVTPTPIPVLSRSLDNSKLLAQFTAPANYALQVVTLSVGSDLVAASVAVSACDFENKTLLKPQFVPKSQAGNKYGNGVAKNFQVIQISIVNECPMAIVVPLAGITVIAGNAATAGGNSQNNDQKGSKVSTEPDDNAGDCTETGGLVAFSLDHVTSIYSADRKLTGRRAVYFNIVQALAAIGSAVEPFLAHGFTQGVAILGGGFTTASKDILVDMSAEQLQNLTSQSFGATEQIASHGSLQKFVFVRRDKRRKCRNSTIMTNLRNGNFSVNWELSPASAEAPTTRNSKAASTAAGSKGSGKSGT
jgi:hypothetical protein